MKTSTKASGNIAKPLMERVISICKYLVEVMSMSTDTKKGNIDN